MVGAYVSGDKAAAEALVAEVKPHLDGGFALASIAADGAASFYHRSSTSDAAVALEATELEPGWLEREYALFRCAMRVPIGIDNSAGVDAALAAAEAEARSDVTIYRRPRARRTRRRRRRRRRRHVRPAGETKNRRRGRRRQKG